MNAIPSSIHAALVAMLSLRSSRCRIATLVLAAGLYGSVNCGATAKAQENGLSDEPFFMATEQSYDLLMAGRAAALDFRLLDAERYFTTLANRPDGRHAGIYYLTSVAFLRFAISDRERDLHDFIIRSDELKRLVSQSDDSPWTLFLGAEANLQRAFAFAKIGRYVKAALEARTAYRTYRRLVRAHPTFHDGYKGYGLLKLSIGSLPKTYRSFLSLLGFRGGVEEGMDALRQAADSSRFNREESAVYLALTDVILFESRGGAGETLKALHEEYPTSPLFAHMYGYFLHENRRADEAEHVFRKAASVYDDRRYFYIDYVDHFLGSTLFRQNRIDESIFFFDRYIRNHEGQALMAVTYLNMGLALELSGKRDEAVEYYAQVHSEREFDSDAVSKRKASKLLQTAMTPAERRLLRGANMYDAGRYEVARDVIGPLTSESWEVPIRAEAAYRMGRLDHAIGDHEAALAWYAMAIRLRGSPLDRWAPWAEYYTGQILADMGRREEAIAAYERALSYGGEFDYYQALDNSASVALQRLKRDS